MKKDTSINIKCETALKQAVQAKANEEGMTFSDWIRWILRRETKK